MRAKSRSKRQGVEFNLELNDVIIPLLCPVLGVPLVIGNIQENGFSPSLDRVDNNGGYIKGNVWVISRRANTIKNDSTLDELEKLVGALKQKQDKIWQTQQQ